MTGAASSIGCRIAEQYSAEEIRVALLDVDVDNIGAARALTLMVAEAVDSDNRADAEAAMAKRFASEITGVVTSESL